MFVPLAVPPRFRKMLKMGVPVHAVAQKMQLEGFDPGVLSGEGEGEIGGGGVGAMPPPPPLIPPVAVRLVKIPELAVKVVKLPNAALEEPIETPSIFPPFKSTSAPVKVPVKSKLSTLNSTPVIDPVT